jgi:tRNA1Val (adenine37-N6)-methyltransferase
MKRKKDTQFHFKRFSVRHDRSGMKVGTDGVLLGAWVNLDETKTILDIGTGTGVIALMLAQRTDANTKIDAIEIHQEAFQDADENITRSPWSEKIKLHSGAIQNFKSPYPYDLIVTNPPYFQNSYKPPSAKRETARHTETLSFDDTLRAAKRLLSDYGRLAIILPRNEGSKFLTLANQQQFQCIRKWSFKSRDNKPVERWLMEFAKQPHSLEEGEIVLYESGEEWGDDYKKLTRDFYLKI